jgi:pyruvate dehydrogenase E1 component alpha subunit
MTTQARQRRSTASAGSVAPVTESSVTGSETPQDPARDSVADDERLRGFYRDMVLVRRFEERAARAYTEALVGGYCHLNLGEEAAVVGLMAALRPTDYLFTNYREHGYAIMRGIDPDKVMAELYGRVDGVSKGWGGSMHMFDVTHRLLGGYGIVGGQLPLATGAALAIDYRGGDEVVMCTLGDGTAAIGAFHESLNIAALWNLPVVYVIINNGLGMGTTIARSSAEPDLYKRGAAYRMASARVDGFDRRQCTRRHGTRSRWRAAASRTCLRWSPSGCAATPSSTRPSTAPPRRRSGSRTRIPCSSSARSWSRTACSTRPPSRR